jgi:hypothetical protein
VLSHFYGQLGGISMATDCILQVTFEFYEKLKPVVARFDQGQASTDGGVGLLKAVDAELRLTERLAACLADRRAKRGRESLSDFNLDKNDRPCSLSRWEVDIGWFNSSIWCRIRP